jgi:predicted nucleotidyltransferase component of viral defense system
VSLFDRLVDTALQSQNDLGVLRPVVEKELLHHDILREMSEAGLLPRLTFIGGTCLRACYGSPRLSEDLDFSGGVDFKREDLQALGQVLVDRLAVRYDLPVNVSEPKQSRSNVSTWKLTVETRPGSRHLPAQRIHIDICALSSHDARPMMLRNMYGVDMGTSGLILQAESREEILADKVIAFAFRQNRMKNRDLWDMGWLVQQGVELPAQLIPAKIADHHRDKKAFEESVRSRLGQLNNQEAYREDFLKEMRRFLPVKTVRDTLEHSGYWTWLLSVVEDLTQRAIKAAR